MDRRKANLQAAPTPRPKTALWKTTPLETDPLETGPPPETDLPLETDPPPETNPPPETDPPLETGPPTKLESPAKTEPPILEVGFQPTCNVDRTVITCDMLEETIGAGTDRWLAATASHPSMFSPFTDGLRLTFDHLCGIADPRSCGELAALPQGSPCYTITMAPSAHSVGEDSEEGDCSRLCKCVIM